MKLKNSTRDTMLDSFFFNLIILKFKNVTTESIYFKYGEIKLKFTRNHFNVRNYNKINLNLIIDEIKNWNIDHHFPIYIAQVKFNQNEIGSDKISLYHVYKNDKVEELRVNDFA